MSEDTIEKCVAIQAAGKLLSEFLSGRTPEFRLDHEDGHSYTRWGLFTNELAKRLGDASTNDDPNQFLIRNHTAGFVGNSPLFRKKGGSGYTPWIDEAERFTEEEAKAKIVSCRGTHLLDAIPASYVERMAKRTIDVQDMVSPPKILLAHWSMDEPNTWFCVPCSVALDETELKCKCGAHQPPRTASQGGKR